MNAEIITIGSEIIYGHIIDTNAAYMGRRLADIGVRVDYMTSIPDTTGHITEALDLAFSRARLILVTGGLGPTDDDITRQAIAEFFKRKLVTDGPGLRRLEKQYRARGYPMTPTNKLQVLVPERSTVMPNTVGSALGFILSRRGKYCFVMPGVPKEMYGMLEKSVLLFIKKTGRLNPILHRTLHTAGIGESILYDRVKVLNLPPGVSVAYLPRDTGVDIRLTASGKNKKLSIRKAEKKIFEIAGEYIFSYDDETIEELIGRILKEKGMKLALAESCTGGLIGDRITSISGSSGYFTLGVTSYSNDAKIKVLKVPAKIIRTHGAVSEPVARAMARGARKAGRADIAIATTGITGPGGGTKDKPVGTICLGLAAGRKGFAVTRGLHSGDRERTKKRFAQAALVMLLGYLRKL